MPPRLIRIVILLALALTARVVARAADNELTDGEKQDGWILLFDGKTPDGWVHDKTGQPIPAAAIEDGAINPKKVGKAYVPYYAKQKFENFTLSLNFKVTKGCNSGVFIRVADPKNPVQSGFEIQVMDSHGKEKLGKHEMGAVYDAQAAAKNASKPAGEWQHLEITAKGNTFTVRLNGELVNEADLNQWTEAGKNPDGSKNKFKTPLKDMAKSGYIGMQDHGQDAWYKNIKVREIK
ncbi:MAG TPA: DUF1080 domain-containing protein [Tepidisphaeraceae bacterium]|nr:DUF1080 domain-containing protein [Tepidisphaeraceae bacterium]